MRKSISAAVAIIAAIGLHAFALAADGETAKAEQNRKKPLQRCDQLADKAQLDCLQKARENVLEARRKREAASENGPAAGKSASPAEAAAKTK